MNRLAVVGLLGAAVLAWSKAAHAQNLTAADVDQIVGRAVAEARAEGVDNGAIAVVDRVGNVLGVYVVDPVHMPTMTISAGRNIATGNGLQGVTLPATFGAIAKAITGAYLSSSGNAFSTRTASQIVQENFNPGEMRAPGGPLFGVQFSQLPCSDLMRGGADAGIGPRRSPLGLAADPGGFPLYKNGQVVGGVGVVFDGFYGLDADVNDYDRNLDELIATAAAQGFAPSALISQRITVNGKIFRYSDVGPDDLASSAVAAIDPTHYVAVAGYTPGGRRDGTVYGTPASGIRADGGTDYPVAGGGLAGAAFVLDDGTGANRYAPRAAASSAQGGLTAAEVRGVITEGLKIAFAARGQIRQPFGEYAQVTISVIDADGNVLGLARTPDNPVFGIDVSLQKARSALFFSRREAAAELRALPAQSLLGGAVTVAAPGGYVDAMRAFVGPTALADGVAYSARAIGLLARPFYPDGINGNPNGPLSQPFAIWSPFNTGLQLDLVLADIVNRLDGSLPDAGGCTALPQAAPAGPRRLANGLQIFPGGVPIYRGSTLIGAVGVSGDGIDQDDMVAFLGLANAAASLGTGIGNAPSATRADTLSVGGLNLRYVSCPVAPFLHSTAQNVCAGH